MTLRANSRRAGAAFLAIASAAILFWFGNGLNPLWPLLWFAPLPVLLFAARASWWGASLTAALAMFVGSFNLWSYLRLLGVPPATCVGMFSTVAVVFALAVLLFRALLRRGAAWSALLALPSIWVCFEYLRNSVTAHGTAGSLAYTQLNFLPFLQLASITGPWGMTFLLMAFPAAIAVGVALRRAQPKRALRIVSAAAGTIALVLIFGALRLARPQAGKRVTVGLAASDAPGNVGMAQGANATRLFRAYAAKAQELAARGAQIIVLPEKLAVIGDSNRGIADDNFQSLADQTKATIVAGVEYVSPPRKYNQARVYVARSPLRTYDKQHMLPPFESDLKPGTALTILPQASSPWGIQICKDMDFTPLSRAYGEAGAGLMLAPAWDFNMDRLWHGHIAIMRGVEDGYSIVRAAKNGYLTVSDDRGRILAERRSDSAPFAVLLAHVPTGHDATLYLRFGDWFPWFAMAALLFSLVQLRLPVKRA